MLARAVCPLGCIAGMAARAVNDRPYKPTRNIAITVNPRAGLALPLPRGIILLPRRAG